MPMTTKEMLLAAQVLEHCNEAAFLAAGMGSALVATLTSSAAIAAGAALGLTDAQVLRMQAEQSADRAHISTSSARRLRQFRRRAAAPS
jgi:hypothetical protein